MTESNFKQCLRAFVHRRPFKPFEVELVSGDRFVVEHSEGWAHSGAAAVYISPDGAYKLFDSGVVSQFTDLVDRQSA